MAELPWSPGSDGQNPMPSVSSAGCSQNIQKAVQVSGAAEVINQLHHFLHCGCLPDPPGILPKPRPAVFRPTHPIIATSSFTNVQPCAANSAASEDSNMPWAIWGLVSSEQGLSLHSSKASTATQDQNNWKLHQVLCVGLAVRALVCSLARVNYINTAGFCQHGQSRDRNMQLLGARALQANTWPEPLINQKQFTVLTVYKL